MAQLDLDRTDYRILREIQANGRISMVELSRRVNLTKTPCAERVKRLEKEGVIKGYFAALEPAAVDAGHIVIVQVQLSSTTAADLDEFNSAVRQVPEIQSCMMMAGGFDYSLKVRTRDIASYRELLGNVISRLPHVLQTHTYVVMEVVKDEVVLSMPDRP
ncbi:winged helix-turn-helix transcriptional regulator [Sneathiella chungangensis]|uniref:Winged helix-turn-helix transcriptional regulator n=1 Tax=Sneathiella chungangensis TaxID=1418234 RepID=A0A845MKA2_9PROT|nr:winged helix-turn-helix transcriptional regulator [Sneathiella chungangensis]MZR23657.1 winged helix-turn-helix transcriptional regulator [Sneathiella chungangensis]